MTFSAKHRLRLAMFTELTRKNGSSRVVCYQFEKYFREAGIDVCFFPPSSVKVYEWFYERFTKHRWISRLLKAIYWYLLVLPKRLFQIFQSPSFDLIFIQRGLFRHNSPPVLEALLWILTKKIYHRPFVYSLDDAQYLILPEWYFSYRFRIADWVHTGNQDIESFIRRFNANIFILESVVDTDYYVMRTHDDHSPVVIGWAGTILDEDDKRLRIVHNAVTRMSQIAPIQISIVSNRPWTPHNRNFDLVNIRWSLEREIENLMHFDIGIMPLDDDDYARAKEGYKLKTYMAMGLPVVCSPVGKNKEIVSDGVNGYFARNEDEWFDHLTRLVKDYTLRAHMGAKGREKVQTQYSLSKAGPQFASWLWQVYHNGHR